ncbi:MAG: flagellar protein FlbD [Waddliaceae bacterium]|nr:flagellar protein FlbD [Waddliaceae bacterium]
MIRLTKFTGEEFFLNPDTVKSIEDVGDTVLTLVTGERLLIQESPEKFRKMFIAYKKELYMSALVSPDVPNMMAVQAGHGESNGH